MATESSLMEDCTHSVGPTSCHAGAPSPNSREAMAPSSSGVGGGDRGNSLIEMESLAPVGVQTHGAMCWVHAGCCGGDMEPRPFCAFLWRTAQVENMCVCVCVYVQD